MGYEKNSETHPTYGVISITRSSGGDDKLFGSSIRHQYKVRISISEAELIRDDLHYDRHCGRNRLIEIEMSQSQFAEFITSMNLGAGVPCTIRRKINEEGKLISTGEVPTTPKREQFEAEFREKLDTLSANMSQLISESNEVLDKKSILKSDREKLKGLVSSLERIVKDSIPFMIGMWNEQMDKTVDAAKGEVEAFTEHTLTQAGMQEVYKRLSDAGKSIIELEALPPPKEE